MSTGRYLKPGVGATSPGIVFSVAVDTDTVTNNANSVYSERVFRSAVATYTKKRDNKWSVPKVIETDNPVELNNWIKRHANKRRRNYVICPIASDVLTLINWWSYAEAKGIRFANSDKGHGRSVPTECDCRTIRVRRCVLRGKPDILDYVDDHCRFVWLSGIQYAMSSEEAIAESIGMNRTNDLFTVPEDAGSKLSTLDRALMWSQYLCHLANWWVENANAPFGLTIGSLAMGVLRTYVKPKSLSTHNCEYTHKLERLACYGGRASCWYVGGIGNTIAPATIRNSWNGSLESPVIPGPIRQLDIRSMYPFLLSSRVFPCKRVKLSGPISASSLMDASKHFGVIASVTIYADAPEYPYRVNDRITYPRGYFQTVLTGADINAMTGKDRIIKVHNAALYHLGEPFKEAAQSLLDMRIRAREQRKPVWESFAKSIANNMGGKLAQRTGTWIPRPDVIPERRWGEWIKADYQNETTAKYRAIAGLVYEYVKDEKGCGPYTAAFAYLTAYGRIHMRSIRAALPADCVISQDTDGIWIVGDSAYDIAKRVLTFGNAPGDVQVKEISQNGLFFGPRHYCTDAGWTLAGFHEHEVDLKHMTVNDTYNSNPVWGGVRDTPHSLIARQRSSVLELNHLGGEISPSGWVRPPYIQPPRDFTL